MVIHPRETLYQAGLCNTMLQIQYDDHHTGQNGAQNGGNCRKWSYIGNIYGN